MNNHLIPEWNRTLTIFFLCLSSAISSPGQFSVSDPAPASPFFDFHYRFPINPGQPGLLAGTMGELRSTHFHAGIDIRTNNMEGVPVITAKQGYVSRAWVSSYGYGNALFVTHPNGQTTVYAHLQKFKEGLGDFVRQYQYQQKSFDTDLSFQPGQFPVRDGDTIAYSGNTGGSSGPHLHFEIRDSVNEALNPLLFNFPEIKDTYSPIAVKIALKTLDINSRINDRFGRFEFYLYKVGNVYVFTKPILAHGRIGVEILAYDKMDRSGFKCGINQIEMFADSEKVFSQLIDKINFTETRGILALMDFRTLKTNGNKFNKLYADDLTRLDYHQTTHNGEIMVDQKDVAIKIVLRDSYGNGSEVKFDLKHNPVIGNTLFLEPMMKGFDVDQEENTLVVSVRPCPSLPSQSITLFSQKEKVEIKPTYQNTGKSVFLVDLRKTLPDSVLTCNGTIRFDYKDVVPSETDYKYYSDIADIRFQNGALYDTLYLTMSRIERDSNEVFSIGNRNIALHMPIDITLKPQKKYPADGKTAVYNMSAGYNFLGGEWKNERVRFQSQEFGDFAILRDTQPPTIRRIQLSSSSARFRIRDNLSGIARFEATVDGNWLLMNYDYKTGILQSERLDKTMLLKGDFQLKVIDQAGNEAIFNQKIQ